MGYFEQEMLKYINDKVLYGPGDFFCPCDCPGDSLPQGVPLLPAAPCVKPISHKDRCTDGAWASEEKEDDLWIGRFSASAGLKGSMTECLNCPRDAVTVHNEFDFFFGHAQHYQDAKALLVLFCAAAAKERFERRKRRPDSRGRA